MKKQFILLILAIICTLCACSDKNTKVQTLKHGWNLKTDTLGIDLQVNLPSEAHADLYAAGIIPHPYLGKVEHDLQWIPQHSWDYTLAFNVSDGVWHEENIDLIFNGLDTYADVWLNGVKIMHSDNMFKQYRKEVKGLLKQRHNILKVHFYPFDAQRDSLIATYPVKFPEKYAVMRKAAYQNGWDWAPRYLNIGIWKDVELKGWSGYKVEDVAVTTSKMIGRDADMLANVSLTSDGNRVVRLVVLHDGQRLAERTITSKGSFHLQLPFRMKNANLWWPNEMGDQTMTDFEVQVYENDKLVDTRKVTTGIRKIELIEEPDSIGSAMYFKVNGRKVYIKGANYVPEEMIETWMSKEKTLKLLAECVPAHFNMLRVWGGGIYPPDYFYDICDSLGIMVWQDFMFAGTTYPYSDEFLNNVREEAAQQVVHYQNHPSLAVWCGNNEVSEGYVNWGWQKSMGWTDDEYAEMKRGMDKLFVNILSQVVDIYDGTRPYWASSPKNGWGKPESLTEGDVHYWGVWWGELPYEMYLQKVGRFNSEFGYQAYPALSTLQQISPELDDEVIQAHQKHSRGEELIRKHIKKYVSDDVWARDVYYSQLSQAYGIGLAIEAQRAAKPRSMGTLYWQLNDAWPVISWSSIDYYGNKKLLHEKLDELYAPILIGVLPAIDGNYTVYVVSDLYREIDGTLVLNVRDINENLLKSYSEKVQIPENGCIHLSLDVNDFVKDFDKTKVYIEMQLVENNEIIATRKQYLVYPKYYKTQ